MMFHLNIGYYNDHV